MFIFLQDGWKMGGVAQEDLEQKSVNSSVLSEVKINYGIDYKDVNVKAEDDYRNAISEVMKTIKPDEPVKEFTGSYSLPHNLTEVSKL